MGFFIATRAIQEGTGVCCSPEVQRFGNSSLAGGQSSPTWRQTAAPPTLRYRVCISTLCVSVYLHSVVSRQPQM